MLLFGNVCVTCFTFTASFLAKPSDGAISFYFAGPRPPGQTDVEVYQRARAAPCPAPPMSCQLWARAGNCVLLRQTSWLFTSHWRPLCQSQNGARRLGCEARLGRDKRTSNEDWTKNRGNNSTRLLSVQVVLFYNSTNIWLITQKHKSSLCACFKSPASEGTEHIWEDWPRQLRWVKL